jgi:formate hydrogenlyase transcriptional activator
MTTGPIHKKLFDPPTATQIRDMKNRVIDLENQLHDLKIETQNDKRLQKELMERLKFEELLSEISSAYTNLPTSEIDNTIEHGLEQIGKFLKADRCNLSQLSKDLKDTHIIHSWSNEGIIRLPRFFADISNYFPWILDRTIQGKFIKFSHPDELPEAAAKDKESFSKIGTLSHIGVPIRVGGSILGHLSIDTLRTQRTWPDELVYQLQRIGEVFANAVARKQKELEIQKAFSEIKMLKEQIEADYIYLREEIDLEYNSHNMIGQSGLFKHMLLKIQQIAPTNVTVLILGETGTGKELVARAIHEESPRKNRPMVKVNCAALPANLIESELFGHEKGAFTSAQARQVGRFELANGNTLFLDEIGELPLESQAKLLRVLQEGEFERLGSSQTIRVDVRIIAASNRDIEEEVKKGRFRQDLWYRLNVFPIVVPPLRQRKEDIELLSNYFLKKFSKKMGKKIIKIPSDVINALQKYQWPGNIRELENVIERAVVNTRRQSLQLLDNLAPSHPPFQKETQRTLLPTIEAAERNLIIQALEKTKWRIEGPKGAALMLGINPSTFRNRMRKHGIQRD